MKLTSMVDFVLENSESEVFDDTQLLDRINNYANFLKQPLELWMFVPCNNLNEPYPKEADEYFKQRVDDLALKYQQAKERCLFVWQDGYDYNTIYEMFLSIEYIIHFQFELTESAIKQLGL